MLAPGDIDHQEEAGFFRGIQKPLWRSVVDSDQVGIELAEVLEIHFDLLRIGEEDPLGAGLKRAIGETFYEKGPRTASEQAPIYMDSMAKEAHLRQTCTPLGCSRNRVLLCFRRKNLFRESKKEKRGSYLPPAPSSGAGVGGEKRGFFHFFHFGVANLLFFSYRNSRCM